MRCPRGLTGKGQQFEVDRKGSVVNIPTRPIPDREPREREIDPSPEPSPLPREPGIDPTPIPQPRPPDTDDPEHEPEPV